MPIYQQPRTTVPHPDHQVYPYLLRAMVIDRPDQVWCADITYIPMRRGFLYLVAVDAADAFRHIGPLCGPMDGSTRKVLSWRVSTTMDVEFCIEALEEALGWFGRPEIFNTDQGSQFTSPRFTGVLRDAGVRISMDGRGRWMDNVFIERLWRSLKYECISLHAFDSGSELRAGLADWIGYYNARRPHSTLAGRERLDYRRQVNRKTLEGVRNPDRNAQFEHINAAVVATQAAGKPVISTDTKKKELVGDYKNAGSDYRPKGCPDKVKVHDFVDAERGKVVPYDVTANAGCVSLGIDNDTAQFSVNSIRRWLDVMGRARYPDTDCLMITADGGGSNGSRVKLFKLELQKLADETGLVLQICHYPPGTSKWNRIEHRLFCHITQTWRGTPLTSRLAVVELIASTTTKTGLTVRCELDTRVYPKGIKVSDAEMAGLNIKADAFHPEWNYTISPRSPP